MHLLVNGGLGNQLFQLAYANYYAQVRHEKVILVPQNVYESNREFLLNIFLENFPDLEIGRIPIGWSIPNNIIRRFPNSVTKLKTIHSINPFFEHPSAYSVDNLTNKPVQFGYFQNKDLLERSNRNLASVFFEALDRNYPDSSLKGKFILHIRGGDLLRYGSSMGVLDADFYSRAIEKLDIEYSQCIVLTDDLKHAKSISERIGITTIIGPKDLDVLESFALMAFSRKLVCANSTFSWWAGVISRNQGGTVYYPKPWFLNWHEDPGNSFDYPGFVAILSSFVGSQFYRG